MVVENESLFVRFKVSCWLPDWFSRNINSDVAAGPQSSSDGIAGGYSKEQALAREYAETTIFFADLVGFTKWSSARSPTEVFHLLETLYGEFDKIATRRNVFKVETIGDW